MLFCYLGFTYLMAASVGAKTVTARAGLVARLLMAGALRTSWFRMLNCKHEKPMTTHTQQIYSAPKATAHIR